jgi:RNA polymerase sigma-70 factor (ECF subfamily)
MKRGESDPDDLFVRWRAGDETARQALFARMFKLLHPYARRLMARQRVDHTLQATALLNETYVQLGLEADLIHRCKNEGHLLALYALKMVSVLMDHERRHRVRPVRRLTPKMEDGLHARPLDIWARLDLRAALERLGRTHPGLHDAFVLSELGLSQAQVASLLGIKVSAVKKRCAKAREWLRRHGGLEETGS